MSLDKILNEIKKDTEKEIEELEKKHSLELKKLDKKKQKELDSLKNKREEELNEAKKRALADYEEGKRFESEMKILNLKNNLLEEAALGLKEEMKSFSASEKKDIFERELDRFDKYLSESFTVSVPLGKKEEYLDLFNEKAEIQEKEIGHDDGFIIESDKFLFSVNLSDLIDQAIEKEKDYFIKILFQK